MYLKYTITQSPKRHLDNVCRTDSTNLKVIRKQIKIIKIIKKGKAANPHICETGTMKNFCMKNDLSKQLMNFMSID